jgi:hypothetical protein
MTYLDEFNGRLSAGRRTEIEAGDGVVRLALDDHESGLWLTVSDLDGGMGCTKLTATQLRRLIADLQGKLGCLTRAE